MFFFVILFAAKIAVVKMDGSPYLCKSDEVGELCISSGATGSAYWGLAGKTNHTFKVNLFVKSCTSGLHVGGPYTCTKSLTQVHSSKQK